MEPELVTYYKLQLAHDLIMFLGGLSIHGLQPEDKAKKVNKILETWEKRIDTQVKFMRDAKVSEICGEDEDLDVQSIIAEFMSSEPNMIRKEFKVEARHSMFRSFTKQEK